jgi:hypothetical protein
VLWSLDKWLQVKAAFIPLISVASEYNHKDKIERIDEKLKIVDSFTLPPCPMPASWINSTPFRSCSDSRRTVSDLKVKVIVTLKVPLKDLVNSWTKQLKYKTLV